MRHTRHNRQLRPIREGYLSGSRFDPARRTHVKPGKLRPWLHKTWAVNGGWVITRRVVTHHGCAVTAEYRLPCNPH